MSQFVRAPRGGVALSIFLVLASLQFEAVVGLKCFVGLGNNLQKDKLKVVDCPDGEGYVCIKMFDFGMGDQVRRKCMKLDRDEYDELLEQEAMKSRLAAAGEDISDHGGDPSCHDTTDHGLRKVRVCYCATDRCNAAGSVVGVVGGTAAAALVAVRAGRILWN